MELEPGCQLVSALDRDGYSTMDLISTLSKEDIMQLEFVETTATTTTTKVLKRVKKYQLSLLVALLDFIDYFQTTQTNFILP
jgi:hypothetical protein